MTETPDHQPRTCLLCTARAATDEQRATLPTLDHGHVCQPCLTRLGHTLDDIPQLAENASADLLPRHGQGGGRTVPASRPPIHLDAVDPALTLVDVGGGEQPVLEVLESWERLVREQRRMTPYGPASTARTARTGPGGYAGATRTLRAVCSFLHASLPWWATRPDLPIHDLDRETRACWAALRRHDPDRDPTHWRIPCPTLTDTGDCAHPLHVTRIHPDEHVHCRRCGRTWDTTQLLAVAGRDADVWVDAEAAAAHTGVPERTIRSWGKTAKIRRQHNRYALADIRRRQTERDAC